MPLVSAKCTNCGANLNVDNTKDAAICEFCGSAFIVEKAINNYKITNHNTINADVVNIYNNNNNNIDLSISIEIQIENYLSLIEDAGYCSLLSPSDLIAMIDISTNNEQIANSKKLLEAVTNYCNNLDFKFNFNYLNPPIHYNLIDWYDYDTGNKYNDGHHFTDWLEYHTTKFDGKFEVLKKIQEKITNYYIDLLKLGLINSGWNESELWGVKWNFKQEKFINVEVKIKNYYLIKYFYEGINTAKKYGKKYIFCLGKYSIYIDTLNDCGWSSENYDGDYLSDAQSKAWILDNKCQHCGGEFKGIFSKVCSKCGKSKDY